MMQFSLLNITYQKLHKENTVSIYKEYKIPLFFIHTEKSYVPFIKEELSYEETDDLSNQTYATGIMYRDNKLQFLEYGLYNDIENQANIEDVYSQIFETISENTMPK